MPFLYPSRAVLTAYQGGDLDFFGLEREYRLELEGRNGQSPEFQQWIGSAPGLGDFTLLCFEKAGEPCHRRILAQWLLENVPSLMAGEIR